ncbi:DNA polymerase III subunit beta [Candidatus Daviesbacteria bacterium RIFCSPHIGHO2_02_FULL_41_14]|uniref:Beta sliding clamp n=1 Tax=Candidatus Curtissbacteria bacterium RIFCSPLOWO2_01_FULL_42_26 TaxID=1797729 RepID=A0A1F5I2L0_9BACT|nr:MAG: DNA polymerase III subunit beta [Candidatus Curtissbacteria bacterium RIFCSPLOWO2_01_FULL_42_26]OGE34631.1 MAG: DNA polymerase III subunit beta [Candidatus Daviesbacteria bacterium RIFCSPHIGHO2_02_FULL_41_14]
MKFVISQADFSRALAAGSKSLLSRANLPILSNILIETSAKKITVLSTDLETATQVTLGCKVSGEGKTTITGKTLLEYVAALPEGEVEVEKLGEELLVGTRDYKARFTTMPAEEFPAIPRIEKGISFEIGMADFARTINRVAFCAAQDEGRPILTGVLFDVGKGKIGVVATDGYRLSFDEVKILGGEGITAFRIIVPAKALIEVARIITEAGNGLGDRSKGGEGKIRVTVSAALNQINFKFGDERGAGAYVEFISRLIEGEFPNWQKIIPASFSTKASVERQELTKLIRISSIFARESGNIIKFKLLQQATGVGKAKTNASISVTAQGNQVGSTEVNCEAQMTGGGGEIAFNFRYVLEILSVMEDEMVTFEMNESLNPGKITGEDARDPFFHIIMPVRLQA